MRGRTSSCTAPISTMPTFACECGGTYATHPRGHRLLVRQRLHALCPASTIRLKTRRSSSANFPADFISEARRPDARLVLYAAGHFDVCCFDRAPFKNCIVLGHVNDKNGIKMSKHKGNVVDPWERAWTSRAPTPCAGISTQARQSVAAVPLLSPKPWSEAQRQVSWARCGIPTPSYVLYADIDNFDPSKYKLRNSCKLSLMDKWILSAKLNQLGQDSVDEGLEQLRNHR